MSNLSGHSDPGSADAEVNITNGKESFQRVLVRVTNGMTEKAAYALSLLKTSIDDETLLDLRINIAGLTGSIEISNFPFCTKEGYNVQDTVLVQDYFKNDLGIDPATAEAVIIYMKDEKLMDKQISLADGGVGAVMPADRLADLRSKVNEEAFKQITGTAAKYVPELEQRDWAIISDSNSLCYGIRVIRVKGNGENDASRGTPVGVERARMPAFRLRERSIWSDSIPSSTIPGVKMELRIPDYVIDDRSYVSIYETDTLMQTSMASSSFSEADVAAAASASFGGFSGSASMSLAAESSKAAATSSSKKSKKVTIAYNFPRVTLFLDNRSLEPTPEFDQDLQDARSKEDMYALQDKYGEFFSGRVQLGGRLFATEDIDETSDTSASEQVKSMKVAAAVSLGGWGVKADVSAGYSTGETSNTARSEMSATKMLTWQASGGDTLLANRPADWAPSVAYHWNWRTTKQDHIANIFEAASQLQGMSWLYKHAQTWGLVANPKGPESKRLLERANTFTLHTPDGRYLLPYSSSERNLVPAAEYINSGLPAELRAKLGGNLRSRGALQLSAATDNTPAVRRVFMAQAEDGKPVEVVKYTTKYRICNPKLELYIDLHQCDGVPFAFANAQRTQSCFVSLHDVSDSDAHKGENIPGGATVELRYWDEGDLSKGLDCLGMLMSDVDRKTEVHLYSSGLTIEASQSVKMVLDYAV